MLEMEEKRKFPVTCPRCQHEQILGDYSWLEILDNLDMFGKTVVKCADCRKYYIIRDEGEGPFVTK